MTDLNSQSARVALDQADAMTLAARLRAVWPQWAATVEAGLLMLQQLTAFYALILTHSEIEHATAIAVVLIVVALGLTGVILLFERLVFRRTGVRPVLSKSHSWPAFRFALLWGVFVAAALFGAVRFGWLWTPLPVALWAVVRIYHRRRSGLGRY